MRYELVVGLEVHVQLNTCAKIFCADPVGFGREPNADAGIVTLALPGVLPRVNFGVVEKAVRLGLALNGHIQRVSFFDRKHYFYPDLPKGYQITQDRLPIVVGGGLRIATSSGARTIGIHHLHLEEDAGKSLHDQDDTLSLIDLNRAGTGLLEVVTEPDFRSVEEVDVFLQTLQHLVRWLDISDGHMEQGSLRCDVNISLRPVGSSTFGQRCEIKNMNSFRFIRQAINQEYARQSAILDAGDAVERRTLYFDPLTGDLIPLRDKEAAMDYRYMPEPDLPPLVITEEQLAGWVSAMPELPEAAVARLEAQGVSTADARRVCVSREALGFFDRLVAAGAPAVQAAHLMVNKLLKSDRLLADMPVTGIAHMLTLVADRQIGFSAAVQTLLPSILEQPHADVLALAQSLGLVVHRDTSALEHIIHSLIQAHPDKVSAYRKGKKGLLGFFMGELMRLSDPKPDAAIAAALLEAALQSG